MTLRHWFLTFIAFFAIAVVLYSPSLGGPFQYDDYAQILDNKVLTGRPLPKLLSSIFRFTAHPDGWTGTRDFVRATFLLNWQWWGEKPLGYRWVNLGIHVVNSTLVAALAWLLIEILNTEYRILNRNRKQAPPNHSVFSIHNSVLFSTFAGLLFLVHPLNSQAVAYVAQRFTSVAALFYLLTIIFFGRALNFRFSRDTTTRGRRPREWRAYCWGILSLISALLAFNSKEIAVTLPVALALVTKILNTELRIPNGKQGEFRRPYSVFGIQYSVLLLIPFFLLALKIPLQTATAAARGGDSPAAVKLDLGAFALRQKEDLVSRREYFLTQISVVGTYLRLAVLPVNQTLDYDYPVTKSLDPKTISLSVLHLGLIGVGGWLLLRRIPNTEYRVPDNTEYRIPNTEWRDKKSHSEFSIQNSVLFRLIGFGILWFYLTLLPESSVIPIPDVIYEHRAYLPLVGLVISAAALGAAAYNRYKSYNLYSLSFAGLLLVILGAGTLRRSYVWGNEVRLWADVYAKAPQKPRAVKNYGVVLAASGKYDDGIKLLEKAVVLDPDNADYWSNLGTANLRAGRFDSAKDKFLTAYQLLAAEVGLPDFPDLPDSSSPSNPSFPSLSEKSRRQAAQYLNDYGVCLVQLGRGDEALAAFQKSLAIDPTLYAARLGLGAAYNLQNNLPAATDVFEALVEEFPDIPDAYNNLAVMYKKAGRLADHDRILKAAKSLKSLK